MLQDADARQTAQWLDNSSTAATAVPKVAPDALRRTAVERWLDARASDRVRVLRGTAGAGKSTAAALWARSGNRGAAWLDLPPGCTAKALGAMLDVARDARLIVIDQTDEASPEARASLGRVLRRAPAAAQFVVIGRCESLDEVAQPAGAVCDAGMFRFGADEMKRLCETNGVPWSTAQIALALKMTHGWATALAAAVRAARFDRVARPAAGRDWRADDDAIVGTVVERTLDVAPAEQATLLTSVLAQPGRATPVQLAELARCGLFVDVIDGRATLNPIVAAAGRTIARARSRRADTDAEPATLTMFGAFRLSIDGRDVRFSRRRDRQIVQYLALRPDGKATRAELFDVFWPDADRDSRSQGLRTACSMIRSALAQCAGREHVDRYFRVDGPVIALRVEHLACDLYRFDEEIARASRADAAGDTAQARSAYAAALATYVAPLLTDEPPTPWIARHAAAVEVAADDARRHTGPAARASRAKPLASVKG